MTRSLPIAPLLALALAGCSSSGGTPASEAMPMNSPAAMMDMPRPDGRSFDVHAVPLPPGAKMAEMQITAHTEADNMAFSFTAPGTPEAIHAWFGNALPKAGYQVTEQGMGFTGTDKAGKMFKLDLAAAGNGATLGQITAGG